MASIGRNKKWKVQKMESAKNGWKWLDMTKNGLTFLYGGIFRDSVYLRVDLFVLGFLKNQKPN